MLDIEKLTQITQQTISDLPSKLLPFKEEIAGHFRIALQNVFTKLDLVTREEFDVQVRILLRTREKLEALENKIKQLEEKI